MRKIFAFVFLAILSTNSASFAGEKELIKVAKGFANMSSSRKLSTRHRAFLEIYNLLANYHLERANSAADFTNRIKGNPALTLGLKGIFNRYHIMSIAFEDTELGGEFSGLGDTIYQILTGPSDDDKSAGENT